VTYIKTDWVDGTTDVNEANLDKIEQGIFDAHVPLDGRLAAQSTPITDWNDANENGWYRGAPGTNAPTAFAGSLVLGRVERAEGFVTQTVWQYALDADVLAPQYVRRYDGSWGPWFLVGEIPAAVEYENVWDAGVQYQAGDVVVYQGVNYLAVNDSVGEPPPSANPEVLPIVVKTASHTLVADDAGKMIEMALATALTLTVPADAAVNFAVGTQIHFIQAGAGQVTVAGAGGVTVNARPGLKTAGLWASGTLLKRAADNWVCLGNMVP